MLKNIVKFSLILAVLLGRVASIVQQIEKDNIYVKRKYTPLYEKDTKQNQNKPMETAQKVHCLNRKLGVRSIMFLMIRFLTSQ